MFEVFKNVNYIQVEPVGNREAVVIYEKKFTSNKKIMKAELYITAHGGYYAEINGKQVSMLLAPGFDCYLYRQPYQVYNVTEYLKKCGEENKIEVSVSRGWYSWFAFRKDIEKNNETRGLKAMLFIILEDGKTKSIETNETWQAFYGQFVSADIYNGETFDRSREETLLSLIVSDKEASTYVFWI